MPYMQVKKPLGSLGSLGGVRQRLQTDPYQTVDTQRQLNLALNPGGGGTGPNPYDPSNPYGAAMGEIANRRTEGFAGRSPQMMPTQVMPGQPGYDPFGGSPEQAQKNMQSFEAQKASYGPAPQEPMIPNIPPPTLNPTYGTYQGKGRQILRPLTRSSLGGIRNPNRFGAGGSY